MKLESQGNKTIFTNVSRHHLPMVALNGLNSHAQKLPKGVSIAQTQSTSEWKGCHCDCSNPFTSFIQSFKDCCSEPNPSNNLKSDVIWWFLMVDGNKTSNKCHSGDK